MSKRKFYLKNRFRKSGLRPLSLYAILPSVMTILALCAGMTGIRMAMMERWEMAVIAVLLAAFFDGIDGRLARFLGSESHFGAELDSLADFVNFGVAPACILYLLTLFQWGEMGWGIALFYSMCCALRLANFNTRKAGANPPWLDGFFIGIPSPIGAYFCLSPIIFSQAFPFVFFKTPFFSSLMAISSGLLMISRFPTFSLKRLVIPQKLFIPFLLLIVVIGIFLYSLLWITLSFLIILYLVGLPFSFRSFRKKREEKEDNSNCFLEG